MNSNNNNKIANIYGALTLCKHFGEYCVHNCSFNHHKAPRAITINKTILKEEESEAQTDEATDSWPQ